MGLFIAVRKGTCVGTPETDEATVITRDFRGHRFMSLRTVRIKPDVVRRATCRSITIAGKPGALP